MSECERLHPIPEDLILALHQQSKARDRLAELIEMLSSHMEHDPEFGVVVSETSEFQVRMGKRRFADQMSNLSCQEGMT